jgi:hypothetical protein
MGLLPSVAALLRMRESQPNSGRENYPSKWSGKRGDPTAPGHVELPVFLGFRMPYTWPFMSGFVRSLSETNQLFCRR